MPATRSRRRSRSMFLLPCEWVVLPQSRGLGTGFGAQRVNWCGIGAVLCVAVSNTCRFDLDDHDMPRLATRAGMNGRRVVVQGLIGQGCRATCAAVLALLVCAGVASADPWRPVSQSCVGASSFGVCSVTHSNSGLWKAVVAPGG